MRFLKTKILDKHVHYFSDGAESQYKNYKIFVSCASLLLTIKSLPLGLFLQPVMAKAHVMESVVQ